MFRKVSYENRSEDRATNIELRAGSRARSIFGTRYPALVLSLLVLSTTLVAHARTRHSEAWARDHFTSAERMREALNGRPPGERTRHDYQRVINAYRNVYFGAPTSTKADPSVVAVAETLVEMGRRFDDDKILNEAIAQYRFLRKEYPGSKYRSDALFTIGEIYQDDLNDSEQARAAFQEFLKRYPHNRLVEDAQQAIIQIDQQAQEEKKAEAQKKPGRELAANKSKEPSTGKSAASKDATAADSGAHAEATPADDEHPGHLPRVTGIRHWSTPDYTRVAIDLESDVKFGSQRISHPDRIFFDLRDTKLASTLVGKTFDVDDGFLKKIRVAQFQPGRTRVVLEVDDLSTYDAFLLPDPYRLIIDIHGKDGKPARTHLTKEQAAALADVEAPPKTSDKPEVPKKVVKADMKALAGQPVSKKEQIHDELSPQAKQEIASNAPGYSPYAPKPNADNTAKSEESDSVDSKPADAKPAGPSAEPKVKKVIVDADDDDPSPAEAANSDLPAPKSRSKALHKKPAATATEDSAADDLDAAAAPASTHTRVKSQQSASRKNSEFDVHEAKPTASGDRSLIRALGLKIGKIVIDPGHGGHDTGTIGPNGLQEKDLVLEVGRRLGKMLETRLGAEVVYTRKDDTFIPLETRTAIANQQRADLFISIHANSSRDPDARGVETYYLNFTSSPEALEVAARENAVSEKSIYELQDLVKKIALKDKIEESREFAGDVEESLHSGLAAKSPAIRDRGVKKAPFIVLIGANMPSILAEISFVSNPTDEKRLQTSDYRQRIAESLYHGIAKYVNGLSGVKLASKLDKAAGQ